MTQLYKLKKKVNAGAKYIISQVGFSARKLQEMLWLMKDNGLDVPLIANIYIINAGHGGAMNRGNIPGCDVTDEFLSVLKAERDKLRELVRDYYMFEHGDCHSCRYLDECLKDESFRCIAPMRLADRTRELGIEVD